MKTVPRDYAAIIWFVGIICALTATLTSWEVAQVEKRIVYDVLFPGAAAKIHRASIGKIVGIDDKPQHFAPSIFQGRLNRFRRVIVYNIKLARPSFDGVQVFNYRTSTTWNSCPRQFEVGEVLHLYVATSQDFIVKECYEYARSKFVWAMLYLLACPLFAFATYKLWRMR